MVFEVSGRETLTEPDEITSVKPDDNIHTLMVYGCLVDIVTCGKSREGYSG